MMEQIVVKTEMEESGEILLFYVDETDGTVEGSVATMDNIQDMGVQIQELPTDAYVMEDVDDPPAGTTDDTDVTPTSDQAKDRWTPDETNRLLIFYVDNKENFTTGSTKKKHLWSIACKTMLLTKNVTACEMKLRNLKRKYAQVLINQQKGINVNFPFLELCNKAFYDDHVVNTLIKESLEQNETRLVKMPFASKAREEPVMVLKSLNVNSKPCDNKVELMLSLYLKYKKEFKKEYWRKDLWERIATEIGEDDGDYWHKRFLNYKHHYLKMLSKREQSGPESIEWPYMAYYDQIFGDDEEFKRKFCSKTETKAPIIANLGPFTMPDEWNITEMTVLVKYYFDCYDEFQDPTIPDNFLWHEVGRLLDKKPDACKAEYERMREEHLDKYNQGNYELRTRVPISILFDNIISKDTELEINKDSTDDNHIWKSNDLDDLVKYFYDNIEMFKDPICYYVCWASIAKKLKKSVKSCKLQWDDLTSLYKSILEEKKENPEMHIDWRYIELFDRIFDYGMDTSLMFNFADLKEQAKVCDSGKIAVKKIMVDLDENAPVQEPWSDEEEYDERGFTKHTKRPYTQSKMFKILEYYQKNKDKFATTQKKQNVLWDFFGKQLGLTAEQCAQKFKTLKQTYILYIEKEIEKPEIPIVWPYYALCKKVFGYRALKAKLKNNKGPDDDWTAKEIKIIINYFGHHFHRILDNLDDSAQWVNVAKDIGKSTMSCMLKFHELVRGYQNMKKMKAADPNVKINWKYFALFDGIFVSKGQELALDHEMGLDGEHEQMEVLYEDDDKNFVGQEEEDYQCIIVIPEGQDISDMENAQIIMQTDQVVQNEECNQPVPTNKWTKRTKKRLLTLYLNYIKSRKGQEIKPIDMWKDISSKLNKTPLSCRKMFAKLKSNHKEVKDDVNKKKTPYFTILEKILAVKPKFTKVQKALQDVKTFKDVPLPMSKVEQALQYYLLHIEEFTSPRFEKKYLWTELANFVHEPVTKVFNKINYLKQFYNMETGEVAGENTLFGELLKEIITEETALKTRAENDDVNVDDKTEYTWCDDEIEQLLIWYLANLNQFKNPKYVRKYLWLDVSNILKKSPLACSKKMSEIRTLYRNMVKENSEELNHWRFSSLCKEIYGTGKKEGN